MVKIIMDTKKPITGKNILVVEDIIDSGIIVYCSEILSPYLQRFNYEIFVRALES